jgi:tetrapyrrole methylase family protein/MazG family protein
LAGESKEESQDKKIPQSLAEAFIKLVEVMKQLRGVDGCPWDKEQTHQSLKKYLLEETYEVLEALEYGDEEAFKEELGDLLLQVVFHAQIAEERGAFNIEEILSAVNEKLYRRHPHVFGKTSLNSADEVLKHWEGVKQNEKGGKLLDSVPNSLPALALAQQLQSRAARVGFDWSGKEEVLVKVEEEIGELKKSLKDKKTTVAEFGDLLFSLVNLSRHLGIDAEFALRKASHRFKKRFSLMEEEAQKKGLDIFQLNLSQLDELWERAKQREGREL